MHSGSGFSGLELKSILKRKGQYVAIYFIFSLTARPLTTTFQTNSSI
jgi:hypothetical protein